MPDMFQMLSMSYESNLFNPVNSHSKVDDINFILHDKKIGIEELSQPRLHSY